MSRPPFESGFAATVFCWCPHEENITRKSAFINLYNRTITLSPPLHHSKPWWWQKEIIIKIYSHPPTMPTTHSKKKGHNHYKGVINHPGGWIGEHACRHRFSNSLQKFTPAYPAYLEQLGPTKLSWIPLRWLSAAKIAWKKWQIDNYSPENERLRSWKVYAELKKESSSSKWSLFFISGWILISGIPY